jgi:hypothetical protein
MALTPNNGWDLPDDSDPFKDGALAIRTLGNAIDTSVGDGLLAWETWAPTLSSGWANGNGTWEARYCQIGKTVHIKATFTVGSTTTKGTGMIFSLPVNAAATTQYGAYNVVASVAGSGFLLIALITSATEITVQAINAAGTYATRTGITATIPATWATGNVFHLEGTYEAA